MSETTPEFSMGLKLGQSWVIGKLPTFSRAADAIMAAAERWRNNRLADTKDELKQEIEIQLWLAAVEYHDMVSDEAQTPPAGDRG